MYFIILLKNSLGLALHGFDCLGLGPNRLDVCFCFAFLRLKLTANINSPHEPPILPGVLKNEDTCIVLITENIYLFIGILVGSNGEDIYAD